MGRPVLLAFGSLAAVMLSGVPRVGGQTPPGDHYFCYETSRAPRQPAFAPRQKTLQDQFGSLVVDVKRIVTICNPAQKNTEPPPAHPTVHQVGYRIRPTESPPQPKFVKSDHVAIDQFGTHALTVVKPVGLLVPSAKVRGSGGTPPVNTAGVDHFACYDVVRAKGAPRFVAPPPVTVTDQFGPSTYSLTRITKLCAPVNKNGEDPSAPQHPGHLVCYAAKPEVRFNQTVSVNNTNFGPAVLVAKTSSELCVPAFKDLPATTTSTTTSTSTSSTSPTTSTSTTSPSPSTSTTTIPSCVPLRNPCNGEEDCCQDGATTCDDGVCCHFAREGCSAASDCCGPSNCREGNCCVREGGPCDNDNDCCATDFEGECDNGTCVTFCRGKDAECSDPSHCCAPDQCIGGRCRPPDCLPAGYRCADVNECCTPEQTFCGDVGGTQPVCCHPNGGSCEETRDCCANTDCCNGACCGPSQNCCLSAGRCCQADATCCGAGCCPQGRACCGGATCCADGEHCVQGTCQCIALQGDCDPNNNLCCQVEPTECHQNGEVGKVGKACCRPVGGSCATHRDCCSNSFGPGSFGPCGYGGVCGGQGASCGVDEQCVSGRCRGHCNNVAPVQPCFSSFECLDNGVCIEKLCE